MNGTVASPRHRTLHGFTLVEMIVAMLLAALVMSASLTLIGSAQHAFQTQGDIPDLQQRLRASVDMIAGDVRAAGGVEAPLRPYRIGAIRDDAAAGVFYRTDTVTALRGSAIATYWLRADGSGTFDLMQYNGATSDLPVVDRVVRLSIDYFAADGTRVDAMVMQDGPWLRDSAGRPFDADLLRVRSIQVRVIVRSVLGPRLVPDAEIQFHAARRTI